MFDTRARKINSIRGRETSEFHFCRRGSCKYYFYEGSPVLETPSEGCVKCEAGPTRLSNLTTHLRLSYTHPRSRVGAGKAAPHG
jgi:hypothetical protein